MKPTSGYLGFLLTRLFWFISFYKSLIMRDKNFSAKNPRRGPKV